MTTMNFPSSPNFGDEYAFNNIIYIWDGVKWVAQKSNEQNMTQLLDSHKQGIDQHSIDGITGLREELDLINSIKATCLVNAIGTGAPHETVSSGLPANVTINTRYVLQNPFGINTPVSCIAEVFIDGAWINTGFIYDGAGQGVRASYKQGEGIILRTANQYLVGNPIQTGGTHTTTNTATSAPCRVFVSKIFN